MLNFSITQLEKKHKKNKTKQNKNKQTNKQNILNLELV